MRAAAVIPALIAYIKIAAVKKLVVGLRGGAGRALGPWPRTAPLHLLGNAPLFTEGRGTQIVYFEKIRVFKAGVRLNTLAWNNRIGRWFYFVGSRAGVMINRDSWGRLYSVVRGEILGFTEDKLLRKHSARMSSLIKNES